MNLEGYEFSFASSIDAARDEAGRLLNYTAHERFANPKGLRLNAYGAGPFVHLKLDVLPKTPGVYVVAEHERTLYVGRAASLSERWGRRGYSVIDPRNCFVGGQSTNCRVNGLVAGRLAAGASLDLWIHETYETRLVEAELIGAIRPPWNIQGS